MNKRIFIITSLFLATLFGASIVHACDSMGPSTHMGSLMSVDAAQHTFTIRDAQSRNPITLPAVALHRFWMPRTCRGKRAP